MHILGLRAILLRPSLAVLSISFPLLLPQMVSRMPVVK